MTIDRASPDDMMTLASERGAAVPMHLGVLLELDAEAAPKASAVLAELSRRCAAVPRLRQRLVTTPLGCGRPVWLDDPGFTPAHHLDVLVLAPVAPDAVLAALAALVLERLPRGRPLWSARVLADPMGNVVAVAMVLHHALADGIGGLSVLTALLDGETASAQDGTDVHLGPQRGQRVDRRRPAPTARALAADAWSARARAMARLPAGLTRLRWGATELGATSPRWLQPTSLLVPTGPRRRIDVVDVSLAAVAETGRAEGATVNEEVLVAVSGALSRFLASRGESLDRLVVSVPVSGRRPGREAELGNAVGVLPVAIPLAGDRRARLAAVQAQRTRLRATPERGSSSRLLAPAFRALAALGLFQVFIRHQRLVHTFETNVRGPCGPLFLAGARVRRVVPVAVNPGNVTVSFDVLSAAGRLVVSIVSDPDLVPDHEVLRAALQDELTAGGR